MRTVSYMLLNVVVLCSATPTRPEGHPGSTRGTRSRARPGRDNKVGPENKVGPKNEVGRRDKVRPENTVGPPYVSITAPYAFICIRHASVCIYMASTLHLRIKTSIFNTFVYKKVQNTLIYNVIAIRNVKSVRIHLK